MYPRNPAKFRTQVLAWLAGLSEKQFAEVFYDAVRDRKTCDDFGHFVLADAVKMDGTWTVDLIARSDPEHYPQPWIDDAPICQSGECTHCRSQIRGWAKHMRCPVCGVYVYGT